MLTPENLVALDTLGSRAGALWTQLFATCAGDIFPCDGLAASVLARTLNLIKGFKLLMEAKNFNCAAPLIRLQLDSLLRFHAVTTCREPHEIALRVNQGTPLRSIKHSSGCMMTDKNLQNMLEKAHAWIPHVYSIASGYIHLSDQHFLHLLMQSSKDQNGTRTLDVSDEDDYVPDDHKSAIIETFSRITEEVLNTIESWIQRRPSVTDSVALKKTLGVV